VRCDVVEEANIRWLRVAWCASLQRVAKTSQRGSNQCKLNYIARDVVLQEEAQLTIFGCFFWTKVTKGGGHISWFMIGLSDRLAACCMLLCAVHTTCTRARRT
jgi:hypothetical protein